MYDIITFGSATRDVFMIGKRFKVVESKKFITKKGLCVPLGSKIHMQDIFFEMGGCGANAAVSFARQGFKVAYLGKVGEDADGREIKEILKKNGVSLGLLMQSKKWHTSYSVIISIPQAERSILEYLGAAHHLYKNEIPWEKLNAKWFYIAPLSGPSWKLFEHLVDFAIKNKIKLAVNPGRSQLEKGLKKLISCLDKIDILLLNQEEAAKLTGLDFSQDKKCLETLRDKVKGIVVITKGPMGVIASDKKYFYKAGIPKSGFKERTGAGDAFGSGFVSGILQRSSEARGRSDRASQSDAKLRFATPEAVKYAIQLGTANATSCIQKIGAVNGLLKKGKWGKWKRVKVALSPTL